MPVDYARGTEGVNARPNRGSITVAQRLVRSVGPHWSAARARVFVAAHSIALWTPVPRWTSCWSRRREPAASW